jgi:CheY-like chemotaxis protein/HPt (histidine-containing phosphotransfer) domain-containing protein
MEDELVKAKHMAERSVIMKDAFLANMSHEIRTPLNAIIGFAELLCRRKFENEETEFIKAIKTSGENLLVIINDILDFSKIEAGMMTFEMVPFNMEELFNSVHLMLSQKAKDKSLELFFDCDQDISKTLSGDPTRLSQIIINIVGNAIKFTPKGSIHVSANVIEQKQETILLEIKIKDTGIGISKDKLDLIFERFSQAETDTTRKYGGTGLGLSITKSLIELQGGFITVNSKLGEGTEFVFQLPFIKVKGNKASKLIDIQAEKVKTRNVKVLLVDDNEMNIKLGMAVLTEAGMKADTASNGLEALKYLKKNDYDVVLMDIQMPEMDGFQATKAIRNSLKSEIPIIAMTANALSGEREKCLAQGMNDYISKPYKPKDLIEKINTIASKGYANDKLSQFKEDERNDKLMDIEILLEITNKNKTITIEIMEMFSHQIPQLLKKIDDELKAGNFIDAKRTIHKTKSSVSIIGSGKTKNLLESMENLSDVEIEEKIFKLNDQLQELGVLLIDQVKSERLFFENNNYLS